MRVILLGVVVLMALPASVSLGQTGACCGIMDGVCTDDTTESDCINSIFGEYMGDGTTCADPDLVCPPIGACCRDTDGVCVRTTTAKLCEFYWGYNWLGEGTTCDGDNPCPQPPRGACCLPSGDCEAELMVDECTYADGVYQGDDSTCETVECPQPDFGACCFPSTGCLVVAEYICEDNSGEFQGAGTICWPNPCTTGEPPVLGWEDDFDSYAVGTFLNHVGGWWGWDDNPAGAATVTDVQARSAPHSLMANDTVDAVHPFAPVFSGGQWIITAWQYLPSDLSGMSYFVVNSHYEEGGTHYWSLEMHFDPATGLVSDATRDPSAASALPIVYDQWVEIRLEIDFDAGSVGTITEYYNDELLITGDYITGGIGQLAIANIDLYAPHSTPVFYDDLSVVPDVGSIPSNPVHPLFVGMDTPNTMTRSTDLSDYPDVTWYGNGYQFEVDGAAGLPDGTLYLAGGDGGFSTTSGDLFVAPLEGPVLFQCEMDNNVSGLAYGGGRLFGFCNYASPMGIYEIDPETGLTTLLVATGSYRYFALDYNAADGLLYGYNEYGSPTGLDSINIDTGEILHVASPVPSANSAARGLACGYNKIYAVTVYGEDYPMYVYDLAQGSGGTWEAMTHPYDTHGGSGAAWIPGVIAGDMNCDGMLDEPDIAGFVQALIDPDAYISENLDCIIWNADINEDGEQNGLDIAAFVGLMLN